MNVPTTAENISMFDVELAADEMAAINGLHTRPAS